MKIKLQSFILLAMALSSALQADAIKRIKSKASFGSGNNPFIDYTLSVPGQSDTGCRNSNYYKGIPLMVGATKMVMFDDGNIQHSYSPAEDDYYPAVNWTTGEHQLDCISNPNTCDGALFDNSQISSTYGGYYDLFGWGTSGKAYGASAYQPYETSTASTSYGNGLNDLNADSDWGANYTESALRTITASEWSYLLFERTDAAKLMRIVCIYDGTVNNGVTAPIYGLLIMPEYSDELAKDRISAEEFNELEYMGGIFLPANGYRRGAAVIYDGFEGYYWTATSGSTTSTAKALHFDARRGTVEIVELDRSTGCSVRLASDATYHQHSFELTCLTDQALHYYKCTQCSCFYGMEPCTAGDVTWTNFAWSNTCSFTCTVCGGSSSSMKHNPTYTHIDGTATHTAVCSWGCGYQSTSSCLMAYKTDGNGNHYKYCKYCGYVDESTKESCTFESYDGYGDGMHYSRCSVCGFTNIAACVFSDYADNTDGTHSATCGICKTKSVMVCSPTVVEGKAATCTTAGTTEGEVCKFCSAELKKQEEIEALGHDWGEWATITASTCSTNGSKTRVCTRNNSHTETEELALDADNHENVVADAAVDATCTMTGLTAGSHCEACHTIIEDQKTLSAIGHLFTSYTYNEDATPEADGTETAICEHDGCDETDTRSAEGTRLTVTTLRHTVSDKQPTSIHDLAGRRIKSDIEELPQGIYIVDGVLTIKK